MDDGTLTLYVEGFPVVLHRRAKALAVTEGLTLKSAVISALRQWCEQKERDAREQGRVTW